jgi:two-component system phosphate regulon sensor histidine kinase PhoR
VFQNLVDNAIKYARASTTVKVAARPVGTDRLAVAISDESDGIPAVHLPRLTERFYRVDNARSRQLGGTGLGLAIVKHVVNRHRGRLDIQSTPGKGSVFTVTLPAVG